MGRCVFFQDWRKNSLKTDQHFCKLGKIWIYIKQCTSCFFMDEHPQTGWALFSRIFAYLPRTWALRGTSWNLLWFVIPALLFRHGVPWTFFPKGIRVTTSVDNFFPQCLVGNFRNTSWFPEILKSLAFWGDASPMSWIQWTIFWPVKRTSFWVWWQLLGRRKQRPKDFQAWHVPWGSTRGLLLRDASASNEPRIWSKQWHTSIRRAWFIVTSNLRLGIIMVSTAEITGLHGSKKTS